MQVLQIDMKSNENGQNDEKLRHKIYFLINFCDIN